MVEGVDVSNYQGTNIDWPAVARTRRFVWVLVTDGLQFVNRDAPAQVAGALESGLRVGGYHFARPAAGSAVDQAERFAAHLPAGCDLAPMLDSEAGWLVDPQENTQWVLEWFDVLAPPARVWYSNRDGVTRHVRSVDLQRAGARLFLAAPAQPDMAGAGAWGTADVVQYGVQPVDGFAAAVDVDRMTEDTFQLLTGADMPLTEDDLARIDMTCAQATKQALASMLGLDPATEPQAVGLRWIDAIASDVVQKLPPAQAGGVDAQAVATAVLAGLRAQFDK